MFQHRWNFSGCYTVENRGEVIFPPIELLIIVNKKPTLKVLDWTMKRFTKHSKLFRDAVNGYGILNYDYATPLEI